jgi:hypothetical protein
MMYLKRTTSVWLAVAFKILAVVWGLLALYRSHLRSPRMNTHAYSHERLFYRHLHYIKNINSLTAIAYKIALSNSTPNLECFDIILL